MKLEHDRRTRPRFLLPLLLLALLISHGLVFLWAKQRHAAAGDGVSVREAEWSRPGKSVERVAAADGAASVAGFRRMLAELERPGTPYSAAEFEELRRELFREWIRRDLRSAMELLHGPETAWRYEQLTNDLYQELSHEMAKHPQEALGWIAMRRFGSRSAIMARHWADALLDSGQVDVVVAGLKDLPPSVFGDCFIMAAKRADAAQLAKLREMEAAMGPDAKKPELGLDGGDIDGKVAYAERKAQLAKGDLAKLLEGEPSAEIRKLLLEQWAGKEASQLPVESAAEAMLQVPEAERAAALEALFTGSSSRGGDRRILAMLDALDERGMVPDEDAEGVHPAALGAPRLVGIALDRLRYDARMAGFAEVLRDARLIGRDELREQMLGQHLRYTSGLGIERILPELAELPAGRDRDALLAGALWNGNCTPELREQLLAAIGDPAVVEQLKAEPREGNGGVIPGE